MLQTHTTAERVRRRQWALPPADAYSPLAGTEAPALWVWSIGVILVVALCLFPLLRRSQQALLLPLFTFAIPMLGEPVRAAALSLPDEPDFEGQSLIIVNAPDYLIYVSNVVWLRTLEELRMPRRVHALAPQPIAMEVERIDERTLSIAFDGGLYRTSLGWLFRGPDQPMGVGHTVELEGMTVEVTEVGENGAPTVATFRFDATLEDPSYRWVYFDDGLYVPFSPPAVGTSVRLPAPLSPMELPLDVLIEDYRKARSRTAGR